MSVATDRLRGQVATVAENTPAPANGTDEPSQPTIYQLIAQQRSEIARALPKHMDADRLARVVTTVIKTNPDLLECSAQSLLGALMLSTQLGLEPGPLGHCYWLPYWNNNAERIDEKGRRVKYRAREVQFIIGYKGIIDLARRSGELKSIEAREVCDKDFFDFSYGLDEHLDHKPNMTGERGPIVAFYGIAKFKDGGHYFLVMSKADVDAHRARSKAKDSGPWVTDYPAMGRKTVIRAMAPFLPLNVETVHAVAADERVHRDTVPDLDALPAPAPVLELTAASPTPAAPENVDTATGEISEPESSAGQDEDSVADAEVMDPPAESTEWPEVKAPGSGGRK
jgi:recombination protein RecT